MNSLLTEIFIGVLQMSFTASIVVLFVLLARVAIRRMPKKYSYFLWGAVGFRLLFPVALESGISLFGIKRFFPSEVNGTGASAVMSTNNALSMANNLGLDASICDVGEINYSIGNEPTSNTVASLTEKVGSTAWQLALPVFVWLLGIALMLIFILVKAFKLRKRLLFATKVDNNVYAVEGFESPFIYGFLRPRIYLPYTYLSNGKEEEKDIVIRHERYHIRRCDHLVKSLAYLLLVIHWFNPLIWLAFILYNKDMEMSCDEKVIEELGTNRGYALALLGCAAKGNLAAPLPLAFGESAIKCRIKNAIAYKKPRRLISVCMACFCLLVFTACATDSKVNSSTTESESKEVVTEEKKVEENPEEKNDLSKGNASTKENDSIKECNALVVENINTEACSPTYRNPVSGGNITASYGIRSGLSQENFHNGVDIAAEKGTQVMSVAEGTVEEIGFDTGLGYNVMVLNTDGYRTRYSHLSEILVKEGDNVSAGDILGLVGSTGLSTGPHLHFSVLTGYLDENGNISLRYVEPVIE